MTPPQRIFRNLTTFCSPTGPAGKLLPSATQVKLTLQYPQTPIASNIDNSPSTSTCQADILEIQQLSSAERAMPSLRNVEVHVTDQECRPLAEFGVQKLTSSNLVSCFVESKSDRPFRISVQPTMPFPDFPQPNEEYEDDENDDVLGESTDYVGMTSAQRAEIKQNKIRRVPYHLLATMRLDGREKFEKQVIIYLDHKHPRYAKHACGTVFFKNRLMLDEEGQMRGVEWVFKDVGIDDLLSAMTFGGGEDDEEEGEAVPLTADDELSEAFGKMGEGGMKDRQESKVGQIEITLEKVIINKTNRGAWKPLSDASKDEGGAKNSFKDVSHTVGRDRTEMTAALVDAIVYEKVEEGTYATFTFFYRSAETLGRFGFPGFATAAQAPSATRKGALAASKLASSSAVVLKERRKREEGEGEDGPVKKGGWEMSVAVRGGRGEVEKTKDGEGGENADGEDEEL